MSEPGRRAFAAKMAELRATFTGGGPAGTAFQFLAPMTAGRQMFAGTAAVALRNEYVQRPSGLLVPAAAARAPQPLDTVAVYLTFEELAGVAATPRRVRDLLSRLGRGDVLLFAATWLGRIGAPGASSTDVDAAYLELFDGDLRQKVANLAHSGGRRLVVRQVLLVLAKLAVLVCPNQTEEGLDAADVLPLVPFALADHLGVSVAEGDPGAPQYIGDSPLTPEVVSNQHF
ncbi:MAG TPA: hypothetical protein VF218_06345, partial [Acidothermaceae bacterium]